MIRMPPVLTSAFALKGGLNQVTAPLFLDPGMVSHAVNHDIDSDGGYRRIAGYTAYDGKAASVAVVPGAGSVLGVHQYNGTDYAFRNIVGETSAKMYKSHLTTGWTEVDLGATIAYTSGGTTEIVVGNTVTGETSGATGIVTRVVLSTGTWAGGDAAGTLHLRARNATAFQAETIKVGATLNLANVAGDSTAVTLAPNGDYQFVNHNFGGGATTTKMYGCDGVNKAFQFDGTAFLQISTGMTTDTPDMVAAHNNHLFLAFGASVQHSSIGNPLTWSPITGAAELAMGEDVTSMVSQSGDSAGGALVITTRNSTRVLYGTTVADWTLTLAQPSAGAIAWTSQTAGGRTYALDDRGLVELSRSIAFGNFDSAIICRSVLPFISERRDKVVCSSVSRADNQYRIHFSDGYSLYVTVINGEVAGAMPIYYPNPITCISSQEATDGSERILFGSSDGYVYEIGGTSFNGTAIPASLWLVFNHLKSPRDRKRYRRAVLDMRGTTTAAFEVGYRFDYDSTEVEAGVTVSTSGNFESVFWDSFVWDNFNWDGATGGPVRIDVTGTGYNLSLRIESNTATADRHTFSGVTLHYTPRRRER